jgi:cbb3-type cytochrome oxidase maturation protein
VDILYLLVPLSLVAVFAIGAVFWWALQSGQFDDLEGPAHRLLTDDDAPLRGTEEPAGTIDSDQESDRFAQVK